MTLEFTLNQDAPASADTGCVVVGIFSDKTLTPAAEALDRAAGGRLALLAGRGDLAGKAGASTLRHELEGITARRVLVVGLGERDKFEASRYQQAVATAARALRTGAAETALLTLAELPVKDRDAGWNIRQAVITADHAAYRYTATLGAKNKKREQKGLRALAVAGSDGQELAQGRAVTGGVQADR